MDVFGGSDVTGVGTPGAPFATITKALTVTNTGDTLHLAPGTYSPSSGESFPLVLPARVSLLGSGVHQCVLSGEGSGTLVRLKDEVRISDIHFERAQIAVSSDLGHYDVNYVRRCRFEDNVVAVRFEDWLHSDSRFVMVNCSLIGNQVAIRHHSVGWDFNSTTLLLFGTTITSNGIAIEPTGSGERYLGLYDSIVWGNADDSIGFYLGDVGVTGNLLSDPAFVGVDGNLNLPPGIPSLGDADPHLLATAGARDHSTIAPAWPPIGYWTGTDPWPWEATYGEVRDLDGDARLIGLAGDAGCDEFLAPTLHTNTGARLGTPLEVRLQGEPGDLVVSFAGFGLFPSLVAGFLWVQPPYVAIGTSSLPASGASSLLVPIPAGPTLAGLDVYLQSVRVGATLEGSGPEWARLLP